MSYNPMNDNTDQILEQLRPRLREARVSHVRRLGVALAVVPILGFGAVALASPTSDDSTSVVASGANDGSPDQNDDLPNTDIGEAGGDAAEASAEEGSSDDGGQEANGGGPSNEAADGVFSLELENYGNAEVEIDDDGVKLVEMDESEGWELIAFETTDDGVLKLVVKKGDTIKVITVASGLWDEIVIEVTDFDIPTTTTTRKHEPEPTPNVVDRIVVEVSPAGSFVVEREGEILWGGNVQPNEGFDYDIIQAEGWKVHVVFWDGELLYHGKAWINDDGVLKTSTWIEEPQPECEPVYQWVETDGGSVKFKLCDGQVTVKELAPAEGFGSYIYYEGGDGAKVDFEGEGALYIVEAWAAEGTIQWETSSPT